MGWQNFVQHETNWKQGLQSKVVRVVQDAEDKLQPSLLSSGRHPLRIGFNRRLMTDKGLVMQPNPQGQVVPWVDVVHIQDMHRKTTGIILSHAAHPVIVHASSNEISAFA